MENEIKHFCLDKSDFGLNGLHNSGKETWDYLLSQLKLSPETTRVHLTIKLNSSEIDDEQKGLENE